VCLSFVSGRGRLARRRVVFLFVVHAGLVTRCGGWRGSRNWRERALYVRIHSKSRMRHRLHFGLEFRDEEEWTVDRTIREQRQSLTTKRNYTQAMQINILYGGQTIEFMPSHWASPANVRAREIRRSELDSTITSTVKLVQYLPDSPRPIPRYGPGCTLLYKRSGKRAKKSSNGLGACCACCFLCPIEAFSSPSILASASLPTSGIMGGCFANRSLISPLSVGGLYYLTVTPCLLLDNSERSLRPPLVAID